MSSLSSIATVNISTATQGVTAEGFGIPAILGYHTVFPEVYRQYTSLSAMVTDGFSTTDPEYLAASAVFAQNPRPTKVIVGRRASAPTLTIRLTPVKTTAGFIYTFEIGGEEFSVTVQSGDVVADICDDLVTAINASSQAFTATDNTTHVTVTADNAGDWFSFYNVLSPSDFKAEDVTTDASIATALNTLLAATTEFYGVIPTFTGKAEMVLAAAWAESNKKLLMYQTFDSAVPLATASNIMLTLQASSYDHTVGIWHHDSSQFAHAAWMGSAFPYTPGSENWAYMTLSGVSASPATVLSETGVSNIETAKGNYYRAYRNLSFTRLGFAASGEYADVVRGIDWLQARMQENLVNLLANNLKIPFTDAGLTLVANVLNGVLLQGVTNGLLVAGSPVVTVPLASAISAEDKAARQLTGVTFSANLAGAINYVVVNGSVSL